MGLLQQKDALYSDKGLKRMEEEPAGDRLPFAADVVAKKCDFMHIAACLLEDRLPNSTDRLVMKSPRLL